MINFISNLSETKYFEADYAEKQLKEIYENVEELLDEYEESLSKEGKINILLELLEHEKDFKSITKMIKDEDDLGVSLICLGLRTCFEKINKEYKRWGGKQILEETSIFRKERSRSKTNIIRNLDLEEMSLSELALKNYEQNDKKIYERNKKILKKITKDEKLEKKQKIDKKIDKLNIFTKSEKEKICKSEFEGFVLVESKIKELNYLYEKSDDNAHKIQIDKQRKELYRILGIMTEIKKAFVWFFSFENPIFKRFQEIFEKSSNTDQE